MNSLTVAVLPVPGNAVVGLHTFATALPELAVDELMDLCKLVISTNSGTADKWRRCWATPIGSLLEYFNFKNLPNSAKLIENLTNLAGRLVFQEATPILKASLALRVL